jgi:hypothetical protein
VARVSAPGVAHDRDVPHEREPRRIHGNDDLTRALVRLRVRRGDGHDDRERRAVGARREPLVAVDHIVASVASRGGRHPHRVRSGELRLGHGEAAPDLAARERTKPPRVLLRGSVSVEKLAVADVRRLRVEQVVADRRLAEDGGDMRERCER